jgi:hypothetical protein
MSKKPTAALSAGLVAVKGTAVPAPDMPGRAPPAPQTDPAATAAPDTGGGMPLNFRVPDSFRREFKVYAAQHGLKLNELLRRSFEAFRRENAN